MSKLKFQFDLFYWGIMFLYEFSYFILYLVTFLVVSFLVKGFFQGKSNGYYFVIPVFIFFYVFPSALDYFSGQRFLATDFGYFAYAALSDDGTVAFYNFYISAVLVLFFIFSSFSNSKKHILSHIQVLEFLDFIRKWQVAIFFVCLIPVFFVLLSGDIGFYSEYAGRDRIASSTLQEYASKISIISVPLVVFSINDNIYRFKKTGNFLYIIFILLFFLVSSVNFYIHGKRSIVAIFVFLLILSLFITKVVSRKTLVFVLSVIISVFCVFLFSYGKNVDVSGGILYALQGLRVDFSRDYSLKFVIYNELFSGNKVLPYWGASYLFLLGFFIPRFLWLYKPYPYAVYFTNSFFGDMGADHLYGWGLTTSFVTEAVSNLGWFGLIIFPIFYIYALRKIDKIERMGVKILGYMIMVMLLIIEPIAIAPIIGIFLFLVFFRKKNILRGG